MTMMKRCWQSNIDDDGDDGNGGDGNGDGNGKGNSNDAAAATNSDDVDDNDGGNLRMAIGQWRLDDNNGTTTICVNDDGNDGNGRDGKGDGNGDGDGDCNGDGDANDAAAINGEDVDDNNGGDSRMAIGCQQWDNNDVVCQ